MITEHVLILINTEHLDNPAPKVRGTSSEPALKLPRWKRGNIVPGATLAYFNENTLDFMRDYNAYHHPAHTQSLRASWPQLPYAF